MKDFNLEWFNSRVTNKQVSIESVHTEDGLLGVKLFNLIINDCELELAKWWEGYQLKINDGSVSIYFNEYKQCELKECNHILQMFRDGELIADISLPDGDCWEDDKVIGFSQY